MKIHRTVTYCLKVIVWQPAEQEIFRKLAIEASKSKDEEVKAMGKQMADFFNEGLR